MTKLALIIGSLTSAIKSDVTRRGTAVANFTVAGTLTGVKADGTPVAQPFFQDVTVFGKAAETLIRSDLQPGEMLTVTGELERQNWLKDPKAPQAGASHTPPRPGQVSAAPATQGRAAGLTQSKFVVRANRIARAYVAVSLITESNGSQRADFGVNQVTLTGNLASDVKVSDTAGGVMVQGSVAVSGESYTDSAGVRQQRPVEYFDFTAWREAATMLIDGRKGMPIVLTRASSLTSRYEQDGEIRRRPYLEVQEGYLATSLYAGNATQAQTAAPTEAVPAAAHAEQEEQPASPF